MCFGTRAEAPFNWDIGSGSPASSPRSRRQYTKGAERRPGKSEPPVGRARRASPGFAPCRHTRPASRERACSASRPGLRCEALRNALIGMPGRLAFIFLASFICPQYPQNLRKASFRSTLRYTQNLRKARSRHEKDGKCPRHRTSLASMRRIWAPMKATSASEKTRQLPAQLTGARSRERTTYSTR